MTVMSEREIFEMAATRQADLRKTPTYTRHALTRLCKHFEMKVIRSHVTDWTDDEGTTTWAINVGDFMMYPAQITKKSIRGTEFLQGWVVERVHVSVNHHSDSPFYEDVDIARVFETSSWIHAMEFLLVESFKSTVAHGMEAMGAHYEFGGNNNGN